MDTHARTALLDIAGHQHGLFTTTQAAGLDVGRPQLRNWARSGAVVTARRSVWRVVGSPTTEEQRALAVVLQHGHGAALSGPCAAWLWRIPGHRLGEVQVLRTRGQHLPDAGTARTSTAVGAEDLTVRDQIPVTTPVRTVFDLAGRQHPARTRRDLNHLMARGLIRLPQLDEALDRLARRGRSGITVMRELIVEAHDKGEPAGSNLELVIEELLETAGYRHVERQVPVYDDDGFIARVDFGDRRRRIAIEVDSDRFHGGLVDRELDERKSARMTRAGWSIVRVVEHDVWWARPAVVQRLRELLWSTTPDGAIHAA